MWHPGSVRLLHRDETHFIEARPVLARQPDFPARLVVRDAVEHICVAGTQLVGKQAGAVHGSLHLAVRRIDDDNHVRHVDVRPDSPVNPLQLVQIPHRPAVEPDIQRLEKLQLRRQEIYAGRTVGRDKGFAVGGEAPALTRI